MTKSNLLSTAAMLAAISLSANAQRPAAPPAAQPTPNPAATAPATSAATATQLPTSKMAVIYTDAFLDPKTGIAKFNTILTKLNGEFQTVKNDLTQLQTRAQTLQDEITKLQQAGPGVPVDQRTVNTKVDQLEQLKKDIQRKGEDAQGAYNRRRQELFAPLQEEIGKALEAFARARGINAIIDGTQVPLLYAADSIDITRPFITEFNSKNPATAVATPPQ